MDDLNSPGTGRTVQSVQVACDVIEALKALEGAGVTTIADHIGWSKATVHGHLATLHQNELVVKNGEEYRLGLRFLDLGEHAKRGVEVYPIVTEEADNLAARSGEVVQFMVKDHGRGVYLYRATGENAIQTASYTGKREYLHCTALGKAILSSLSDTEIEAIVDHFGLPSKTENTVTSRDALFEEIEQIRETGIAVDDEEIVPGLRCVSAPISPVQGHEYCAISISGPKSRFKGEYFNDELPEKIMETANTIEINASHTIET